MALCQMFVHRGVIPLFKPSTCGTFQHRKSLNAEFFSSPRMKSHAVSTEKYFLCKEDKNNCSTTAIDVSNNNVNHSAEMSCTHAEQVVQIPCDASTELVVLTIDDVSNGVSILAQDLLSELVKNSCWSCLVMLMSPKMKMLLMLSMTYL
jgi:hypothetical protein